LHGYNHPTLAGVDCKRSKCRKTFKEEYEGAQLGQISKIRKDTRSKNKIENQPDKLQAL